MARWIKGKSGNPKGRPTNGSAIAGLARSQVEKYKLIDRLESLPAPPNTATSAWNSRLGLYNYFWDTATVLPAVRPKEQTQSR